MTNKSSTDEKMISLSNIPDDLLPAFSTVDRAVILVCKIVTGKKTEAQVMEMIEKHRSKYRG